MQPLKYTFVLLLTPWWGAHPRWVSPKASWGLGTSPQSGCWGRQSQGLKGGEFNLDLGRNVLIAAMVQIKEVERLKTLVQA